MRYIPYFHLKPSICGVVDYAFWAVSVEIAILICDLEFTKIYQLNSARSQDLNNSTIINSIHSKVWAF